jgi:hypothetical protein
VLRRAALAVSLRQHPQGICCTARVYILVHVMWVPPGASLFGVGRSGPSLATILIPLLLKLCAGLPAADCDTMTVVCASLSTYVATRTEIGPAAE